MTISDEIASRQSEINLQFYNNCVVVGVGGIGSWVALDLALSGSIANLFLIDPDIIENSNLNRTPFRLCDVGCLKVDALKYLILERRLDVSIITHSVLTSPELIKELDGRARWSAPNRSFISDTLIIDCRDDVYDDLYYVNCKYYKVGYDGLSITIDGNPRLTAVWGESSGYTVTPSFIASAQLAAALVVTDALTTKDINSSVYDTVDKDTFDVDGKINTSFTIDARNIIMGLYKMYNQGDIE